MTPSSSQGAWAAAINCQSPRPRLAYAIARGVSANQLRCETTSNATWGNLLAAARLMQQQGGPTPYTRNRTWNSQLPFLLHELFFVNQYHLQRLLPSLSNTRPEVGDGLGPIS